MKIPTRSNRPNNRLAYQDKFDEREIWHKLVVKIISWKDGFSEGRAVKTIDKITSKEWSIYSKRMLKTNISYSKQKILANLKEIKDLIKKNGGFEEDFRE